MLVQSERFCVPNGAKGAMQHLVQRVVQAMWQSSLQTMVDSLTCLFWDQLNLPRPKNTDLKRRNAQVLYVFLNKPLPAEPAFHSRDAITNNNNSESPTTGWSSGCHFRRVCRGGSCHVFSLHLLRISMVPHKFVRILVSPGGRGLG